MFGYDFWFVIFCWHEWRVSVNTSTNMGSSDYQKCTESVKEIKTITVTGGEEEGVFNKLS